MPHWEPSAICKAQVVRSFLPLDKHPTLKSNPNYQNVYPGDELYVFEQTSDNKWFRAYLVFKPLPKDFIAIVKSWKSRPTEQKIQTVVVPARAIRILENVDPSEMLSRPNVDKRMTLYGMENGSQKPLKPQFRFYSKKDGFADEISTQMIQLCSHIFAVYGLGDYETYKTLLGMFHKLNEIRLQLKYDVLTQFEKQEALKTGSVLLTKVAKVIATLTTRDVAGFQAILPRENGNLLDYNPVKIAKESWLYALLPNYPVSGDLQPTPPADGCHLLVDFKMVSSSPGVNPNFSNMTAYMYLRTDTKRLTEAFSVEIESMHKFSLKELAAALFTKINYDVDTKIYLVAVLTERVPIEVKAPISKVNVDFTPFAEPKLTSIKRGIACGVADISRVFSKNKNSLAAGEAHNFRIKMFGSYLTGSNLGWGEAVDRIISSSSSGIALNPRAESLVVSIMEFTNNSQKHKGGVEIIRPLNYDYQVANDDRLYLHLGKVELKLDDNNVENIMIRVTSTNEKILFRKGSNQQKRRYWDYVSTRPNESIGEIVRIDGLTKNPETLQLMCYLNGVLMGKTTLEVVKDGKFLEYWKIPLEFTSSRRKVIASVLTTTEYAGNSFNIDPAINSIFQWKGLDPKQLLDVLRAIPSISVDTLAKYFDQVLVTLLKIFESSYNGSSRGDAFLSIIQFIDITMKSEKCRPLFKNFIGNFSLQAQVLLPQIGAELLISAAKYFTDADQEWGLVGRCLCRIAYYFSTICRLTCSVEEPFNIFYRGIAHFIKTGAQITLPDKIVLLETMDTWGCSSHILLELLSFSYKADTAMERKLLISKMLLLNRLLKTHNEKNFLDSVVNWCFEVYRMNDPDSMRLANTIIVDIVRTQSSAETVPLLSTIANYFVNIYRETEVTFDAKKKVTRLFQKTYPFVDFVLDSLVNQEIVSELLIELATIIACITKNAETGTKVPLGNNEVMLECAQIFIEGKFFPSAKWVSLHALFLRSATVIMEMLPANERLLNSALSLCNVNIISSLYLADAPKKAVDKISGDVRSRVGDMILMNWDEDLKFDAEEAMMFSLQTHTSAWNVGSKILWNMIQKDKVDLIMTMYNLVSSKRYIPLNENQLNHLTALKQAIQPTEENRESVAKTLSAYEEFLHIVGELDSIPDTEEFDNDRTAVQMKMFEVLNKPELYNSLMYDLYDKYFKRSNHTQAGLALEALAAHCSWDTEFEKKESMYKEIAKRFISGKDWGKALEIDKELVRVYENSHYDLRKLSVMHSEISKLYYHLQSPDKPVPTYFKVSFMGFGFPPALRQKTFIYEGLPYEHISSICSRLLLLYPGSTLTNSDDHTEDDMGRYLHIITVDPKFDRGQHSRFVSQKRVSGTVEDLWVDENVYTTRATFPTLMNRSEVVDMQVRKISPVENAVNALKQKIKELKHLEASPEVGELSRVLFGAVDSPVNGGIGLYKVFFDESEEIKKLYTRLVVILGRCLVLHKDLVSDSMIESHQGLVDLYKKNFATDIVECSIDVKELEKKKPRTLDPETSRKTTNSNLTRTNSNSTNGSGFSSHDVVDKLRNSKNIFTRRPKPLIS